MKISKTKWLSNKSEITLSWISAHQLVNQSSSLKFKWKTITCTDLFPYMVKKIYQHIVPSNHNIHLFYTRERASECYFKMRIYRQSQSTVDTANILQILNQKGNHSIWKVKVMQNLNSKSHLLQLDCIYHVRRYKVPASELSS